ncbi:hypothetical protein ACFWWX_29935, partial [Streptomyces niveus]
FSPLGVDSLSPEERQDRVSLLLSLGLSFVFVLIALSKGKLWMALVGTLVPPVAIVGALRLARPGSPWARRFYRRRHRARARMTLRAYHRDRRWSAPRRRVQDWIGGAPDDEPKRPATPTPPR